MKDFVLKDSWVARVKEQWSHFEAAGLKWEFSPHLLAAIALRETRCQSILGDSGHGHGIMQIDDHSYRDIKRQPWKDPAWNIDKGASILQEKWDYLADHTELEDEKLLWFSVAAYNCGQGNMTKVWQRYQAELDALAVDTDRFMVIASSKTWNHDYCQEVYSHYTKLKTLIVGA